MVDRQSDGEIESLEAHANGHFYRLALATALSVGINPISPELSGLSAAWALYEVATGIKDQRKMKNLHQQ